MALLEIRNLHVRVEEREILHGLDLIVNKGEVHAIMGPNGSGKSTLAHVLAGREGYTITSGSVSFRDQDLLAMEQQYCRQEPFVSLGRYIHVMAQKPAG